MKPLGRLLTAMVTPFDAAGQVDLAQAAALARRLIAQGSEGLVVVGTTGESPTLAHDEKLALYRTVREAVGTSATVVAGTGSNDTAATVTLTREATELGVDGILLINPYYNKPNQEGLYRHFRAAAEATHLPVMLYNHPPRTGVAIAPETLRRLAQVPNIVALKDSSGSLDVVSEFMQVVPEHFMLYSGNDSLTLPIMAVGGYGVVSVASHVVGPEFRKLIDAAVANDWAEARRLHYRLWEIMNGLFIAPSPAPTKAALRMLGFETGGVRLPLVPCTDSEIAKLEGMLMNLGLVMQPVEA